LKKAASDGVTLQNIRSVGGFQRRLNDITCSGCHQTRGIGGFHFPGVDWLAAKPSNSASVPASPHFFGDQVRRRDILAAMRDGKPPNFSRGPPPATAQHGARWHRIQRRLGAHCQGRAKAADNDPSFRSRTCAKGLVRGSARAASACACHEPWQPAR
jgi:hypothetical protein